MNCGECWGNIHLNNAIIAQVLAIGQNCQDMEMLKLVVEILSRIREPKAQMVTGERAFPAASLLFMENWHQVFRIPGNWTTLWNPWGSYGIYGG